MCSPIAWPIPAPCCFPLQPRDPRPLQPAVWPTSFGPWLASLGCAAGDPIPLGEKRSGLGARGAPLPGTSGFGHEWGRLRRLELGTRHGWRRWAGGPKPEANLSVGPWTGSCGKEGKRPRRHLPGLPRLSSGGGGIPGRGAPTLAQPERTRPTGMAGPRGLGPRGSGRLGPPSPGARPP